MIVKIPVPLTLLKQSLGIRETDDIIKASISNDVVYLYTVTEGNAAAELTKENDNIRMEFSYSVGANETSQAD